MNSAQESAMSALIDYLDSTDDLDYEVESSNRVIVYDGNDTAIDITVVKSGDVVATGDEYDDDSSETRLYERVLDAVYELTE